MFFTLVVFYQREQTSRPLREPIQNQPRHEMRAQQQRPGRPGSTQSQPRHEATVHQQQQQTVRAEPTENQPTQEAAAYKKRSGMTPRLVLFGAHIPVGKLLY